MRMRKLFLATGQHWVAKPILRMFIHLIQDVCGGMRSLRCDFQMGCGLVWMLYPLHHNKTILIIIIFISLMFHFANFFPFFDIQLWKKSIAFKNFMYDGEVNAFNSRQ